jgi:hypothetical protein
MKKILCAAAIAATLSGLSARTARDHINQAGRD